MKTSLFFMRCSQQSLRISRQLSFNPTEHVEYRWFSVDETRALSLVPGTRECLDSVHARLFPPKQLSLFPIADNVLTDSLHIEQGRIEGSSRRTISQRPIRRLASRQLQLLDHLPQARLPRYLTSQKRELILRITTTI